MRADCAIVLSMARQRRYRPRMNASAASRSVMPLRTPDNGDERREADAREMALPEMIRADGNDSFMQKCCDGAQSSLLKQAHAMRAA